MWNGCSAISRRFLKPNIYEVIALARSLSLLGNNAEKRCAARPDLRSGRGMRTPPNDHSKPRGSNVVSGPFGDVRLSNELFHEFVWKNLERWADKTAVVCSETGRSYTYSRLRKLSGRFAKALRSNRFFPRDTIAIVLPNVPEFAIVLLGASEAGVQVTAVNPAYTAVEISLQIRNSGASGVVTNLTMYPVVLASLQSNRDIKIPIIVINDGQNSVPSGCVKLEDLISDNVEEFARSERTDLGNEGTAILPYSSGTTGLPKGVELTHRTIVANLRQLQHPGLFPGFETTGSHQDVVPIVLPFFHIYGMVVCLLQYLSVGAKLVCISKFEPEGFLKCLKDYKASILYLAPPLILFLGNNEKVKRDHLDSIRFFLSGAAPIGAQSVQRFLNRANRDAVMGQGYGLSETSPVVTMSRNCLENLDSVGCLLPNTQIRVVGIEEDNAGQDLPANTIGELYVRGPQVMKGYYKNPGATMNAMDGDWLKTGDLGCYDDKGFFYVKDRLKELIKVKGFQVAPAELEELLRSNDKILDAAVIGVPHDRYGEIPKAYVVRKSDATLVENEVKDFISKKVASHKQLGHVTFLESIPKSAAGKILRRKLKDL